MKPFRRQILIVSVAGLTACGAPAVATISSSPQHGAGSPTAKVLNAHLLLQHGEQPGGLLSILDTRSGTATTPVPSGVVTHDWARVYTTTSGVGATLLRAYDVSTGATVATVSTAAGFGLPSSGGSGKPSGLSSNGRWLVLAGEPTSTDRAHNQSGFLVFDTSNLHTTPHHFTLNGYFIYDGINNNGDSVYLLQNLNVDSDGGRYNVRRFDLANNRLDPQILVDKRTGERDLSGDAVSSVNSPDGAWQFTVYAFGSSEPMIHALNLADSSSWCIDLPRAPIDQGMDLLWGLAASRDGRYVYAINGGNGAVVKMPLPSPWEAQQASFPVPRPQARESSWLPSAPVTAQAKRLVFGAAVLSRDDRTLYGIGDLGIFAVDTATLKPAGPQLLAKLPLTSLALSADGEQLYATSLDTSTPLVQVDRRSGAWAAITAAGRPLSVLLATR